MKGITVLTPTYNRAALLEKCYESLNAQTCKDFLWLIVDDGSQDDTKALVEQWQTRDNGYEIRYIRKENGGKHTALNEAFPLLDTELTFIVDSDDRLTEDAVAQILLTWQQVKREDLAGLSFLRGYSKEQPIGTYFPREGICNGIDMQFRTKVQGDKAEVWRSDILKQYRFPVFEGERFQGENYIWWQIAQKYDLYYVNKIIYLAQYLEGGLSRSGRKLRISCPLGGMENSRMGFGKKFPLKERCKRAGLYVCYGKFAGFSFGKILSSSGRPWLVGVNYPFGWLLYHYWKAKYQ